MDGVHYTAAHGYSIFRWNRGATALARSGDYQCHTGVTAKDFFLWGNAIFPRKRIKYGKKSQHLSHICRTTHQTTHQNTQTTHRNTHTVKTPNRPRQPPNHPSKHPWTAVCKEILEKIQNWETKCEIWEVTTVLFIPNTGRENLTRAYERKSLKERERGWGMSRD